MGARSAKRGPTFRKLQAEDKVKRLGAEGKDVKWELLAKL